MEAEDFEESGDEIDEPDWNKLATENLGDDEDEGCYSETKK